MGAITHPGEKRINIPTAEMQPIVRDEHTLPIPVIYERRNRDLDPQLVWRGKDEQDQNPLTVATMPLFIQEKIHPKVLIEDLIRQTKEVKSQAPGFQTDFFADFNGTPAGADKTEYYQHDQNWTNRMILGDSLQVMASLAEREGLRGKVQCIYFDPPYGIKFNSNFQWSTTSRKVMDGNAGHITREPEQVKAFRDTWRDGIHSYLTYLRDRLTVARDLLADSGSLFVQIGDENVHRVRAVMEEVFGENNFIALICVKKTGGVGAKYLDTVFDYIVWFGKNSEVTKYRGLITKKIIGEGQGTGMRYDQVRFPDLQERALSKQEREDPVTTKQLETEGAQFFQLTSLNSESSSEATSVDFKFNEKSFFRTNWKTNSVGLIRLKKADRIRQGEATLRYRRQLEDFPGTHVANFWDDTGVAGKVYVVQTSTKVVERCLLMATDPGDLVLDPTCGSGTTATVAEQWGRRWITIDTSRVALALARARIMGARYPFYLLADSREGQIKEAEVTRTAPSGKPVQGNIRHGFVYERVPHITLGSIARNAEIDVIWDEYQAKLEPLRNQLNASLGTSWQEWEIPRELTLDDAEGRRLKTSETHLRKSAESADKILKDWWQARIARQKAIDASIAAKAEFEYLYDKPYPDNKKVRVAGPFTVESLSPHRMLGEDETGKILDPFQPQKGSGPATQSFAEIILENLKTAGVQQATKEDKISFVSLIPWPGRLICAEGVYHEGDKKKRAAIFIGPEFGTLQRADLVQAALEAADAAFDVVIVCAFNFEAHTTEFSQLGKMPVLKARMNADLHMATDFKTTQKANLFVIFGEPDIEILPRGKDEIAVKIRGVDVYDPTRGEIRSDDADNLACWFVDTDYNGESFFVRQAYFPGTTNDPYKSLKTTMKAEIDADAWESINKTISRPFAKPASGRIAIKMINHLGDEALKVYKV
ncbi:MAG: site-specific DNA-methyltransferase [Planctomycetota bacterium]|nr:site-specific DNA-methyltransferase [Planctomycetota bacterium]